MAILTVGNGGGDFATVQAAVSAANAGDIIKLPAGTFDLSGITIDKSLTFDGANAGVNGNATRSAETDIVWSSGNAVNVSTTAAVTFDGLSFTGTHVIVASLPDTNVTFTNSVFDLASAGQNNNNFYFNVPETFNFTNNKLDATGYSGALFQPVGDPADPLHSTVTFSGNTFTGHGANYVSGDDNDVPVIANLSDVNGHVENNTFNNVDIGVLVANGTGPLDIDGNTFEHMHRLPDHTGGGLASGVVLFQPAFNGEINVSGNSFSDSDAGVRTSNVPGTSVAGGHIDIDSNSFTGVPNPVFVTTDVDGALHLTNSTIDGTTVASDYFASPSHTLTVAETGAEFTSIQAAINAASAGDIIQVAAGNYTENLVIDKAVIIEGANHGLSGTDPNRGPETVITGDGEPAILLQSSGITLDGLKVVNSTAGNDGIENYTGAANNLNNVVITNNVVEVSGTNAWGVYFYNFDNSAATFNTITNNAISGGNGEDTIGIVVYNESYANISGNTITGVDVGIQTGNDSKALAVGAGTPEISDNTIVSNYVGIYHNLQYGTATAWTIDDNDVSGVGSAGTDTAGTGIRILSISNPGGTTVTDNDVSGFYAGYQLWNDADGVTIVGGNVTDNKYGVEALDHHPTFGAAQAGASDGYAIDGVTFTGNDTDVRAENAELSATGAPSNIKTVFIEGDGTFDAGSNPAPTEVRSTVSATLAPDVKDLTLIDGDSNTQTFDDGMSLGPITDGENGWKVLPGAAADQAIVNDGTDNHVLHISSDPSNGNFSGPYSPGLSVAAGEKDAGAAYQSQSISFDFKAVSASPTDLSRVEVDFANEAGTDRNNFLVIETTATGIRIAVSEPTADGQDFTGNEADNGFPNDYRELISGVDASVSHHLELRLDYVDGANNDVIGVYLDGEEIGTTTTFENYHDGINDDHVANAEANLTDRIMFRVSNDGQPTDGSGTGQNLGFNFDNLTSAVYNNADATGNDLDNVITGNTGNNVLTGGGGNDTIDGGAGIDTAKYTVSVADSAVTFDKGTHTWTVNAGTEGTDHLVNVEQIADASAHHILLVGAGGYATIQAAINAANAGDTIEVGAGTYAENLTIDKDLTIIGDGDDTIIKSSATMDVTAGERSAVIMVEDANVNISNFTVDGEGRGDEVVAGSGTDYHGIAFINAGGSVDNVDITGIREALEGNGHVSGVQQGRAIYANNTGAERNLSVTDSTVSDFQKNGIDLRGNLNVTVDGNTVTGDGATSNTAQNGIVIGVRGNAHGAVVDNHVSEVGYTGDSGDVSAAILSFSADVSVTGNTVTAPTAGEGEMLSATGINIYNDPTGSDAHGNEITGFSSGLVSDTDGAQPGNVADNTFTGNEVNIELDTPTVAVNVTGTSGADHLEGSSAADTLTGGGGNDTIDGGTGIDTAKYTGTIAGSAVTFDKDTHTWTVNAGTEGTDHLVNIEQIADASSHHILLVGAGGYATIQAAIDAAHTGDTIEVAAGVYTENLNINKAVTILGAHAGDSGTAGDRNAASGDGETTIIGHEKITATDGAVTLDGLRFVNDGTTMGGTASNPTLQITSGEDHVITNSVFYSSVAGGGDGDRAISIPGLADGDITISNNYFTGSHVGQFGDASWSTAIWSDGGGAELDVTGNTIENSRTGLNLSVGSDSTDLVDSNTFHVVGSAVSVGPVDDNQLTITNNNMQSVGDDFNFRNVPTDVAFDAEMAIHTLTADNTTNDFVSILGGGGNDHLSGTAGSDFIDGNDLSATHADNDVIDGRGGDDFLMGNGGDDIITGGAGNDTIDGGTGTDTAVYSGNWKDYTITQASGTTTIVDHRTASPDGTDTVTNVETFQFANGTFDAADLINQAPTEIDLSANHVNENAVNGTIVGQLTTIDPNSAFGDTATYSLLDDADGRFGIDGNNIVVKDGSLLDFEAQASWGIKVQVTDAGGLTHDETFTIDLNDLTDTSLQPATAFTSVDEGTTAIGNVVLGDGGPSVLTFALAGADAAKFQIDSNGNLSFKSAPDFENKGDAGQDNIYDVIVLASDASNNFNAEHYAIQVKDVAPGTIADVNGGADHVLEGSNAGTLVGITASSNDGAGTTTYSLTDDAGGRFQINATTGVVSVKNGSLIDFETATSHSITVQASDGTGTIAESFTIAVDDRHGNTITGTSKADQINANSGPSGQTVSDATTSTIVATSEDDTIHGGAGKDIISGLGGNDTLTGDAGDDFLNGNAGDDTLTGGVGKDTLTGGNGNDTFQVSGTGDQNDIFIGNGESDDGEGDIDTLFLTGMTGVTLAGFNGSATSIEVLAGNGLSLLGTSGKDTFDLHGMSVSGLAFLNGGAGDDIIIGSNDGLDLRGGAGNDHITGGTGNDTITGGAGADILDGGAGINTLSYAGSVAVNVNLLSGIVSGGDAKGDTIVNFANVIGSSGNDTLKGDANDNVISGGAGKDNLSGGAGNDTFLVSGTNDRTDIFDGGEDSDTLSLTGATAVTLAGFNGATTHIESLEGNHLSLLGTSAIDTFDLHGMTVTNLTFLDAGAGNDIIIGSDDGLDLRGGAGGDTITGGSGNDIITGGAGLDHLHGGAGDDTFIVSASNDTTDTFDGGADTDTIQVTGTAVLRLNGFDATASSIESWDGNGRGVTGSGTGDIFDFSGLTSISATAGHGIGTIDGGAGDDTITGSLNADTILGNSGNDIIHGGAGNDVITGGAGTDHLFGDDGDDTFIVSGTADVTDTFNGGAGDNDTIQVTGNSALSLSVFNATTSSIEMWNGNGRGVTGTGVADTLDFSGLTSIVGHGIGTINGGAGDDTIVGSNFANTINGGAGHDTITGGGGADIFVFSNGGGLDTFTDYTAGVDKFDLRGMSSLTTTAQLDAKMSQVGTDVQIQFSAKDIITIQNHTIADLQAHYEDFLLN